MRFRLAPSLAVTFVTALIGLVACSSESEGQPCSIDNGNNDCDNGLVCEKPPNNAATNAPAVCCPPAGQSASTPECSLSGQIDSGNPAPPDASTVRDGASTSDSGFDARASDSAASDSAASDSGSAVIDGAVESALADGGPG